MSEQPIKVTPEGVDIEPRKTGHNHLDLILAGAAILMSLISLGIALKHGQIMKDLVSANSWPLLQYETGNYNAERKTYLINLGVENGGIGPAIVKKFTVYYNGLPQRNGVALLAACCGYRLSEPPPAGMMLTNPVANTVIKPGEKRDFLKIEQSPENLAIWQKLDRARFQLRFDVCYCSALGECWRSDLETVEAKPVDSCPMTNNDTHG